MTQLTANDSAKLWAYELYRAIDADPGEMFKELLKQMTRKIKGQAESVRVWNYPVEALEELVANALYHRDYQTREPVEIRVYPDKLILLNYGGPDRSIKLTEFLKGGVFPRRYRNRRLGDFLKELDLTEGKATGIPTIRKVMKLNGTPMPDFITDEDRSFFQVNVPIHLWFSEQKDNVTQVDTLPHTIPHTIGLSEKQSEVLSLIQAEPRISIRKIAERLALNNSTVVEHIDSLSIPTPQPDPKFSGSCWQVYCHRRIFHTPPWYLPGRVLTAKADLGGFGRDRASDLLLLQ